MEQGQEKGRESIPISSLSLPTANTARRHLGEKKKSEGKQVHPGYSMFDWNKLCHSGRDMSGTGGKLLKVTAEELATHNSDQDLWTSVRGVVYNVTEFTRYHPGGKAQLMRGAGKDCTELFDKIHVWVNSEAILKECIVGKLTGTRREHKAPDSSHLMTGTVKPPFPGTSSDQAEGGDTSNTVLSIQVPTLALKDIGKVEVNVSPEVISEPPVLVVGGASSSTTDSSVPANSEVCADSMSGQVFVPVPTITNTDELNFSFPVPNLEVTTSSNSPNFTGQRSQSSSNTTAPSLPSIHVQDPETSPITNHTLILPVSTNSAPSSSDATRTSDKPSDHTFRTNIKRDYSTRHPLISRTAYESEV